MRIARTGWLLLLACGLLVPALGAVEHGDLAPRGSLGYGRVKNLGDGAKRLAGEDWMTLFDRALRTRRAAERGDSDPIISELKRFVDHAGTLEVALVDLMVRDPHVQMTFVLHLSEGAPRELSEAFVNWVKNEAREAEDLRITRTEVITSDVAFMLRPGLAVLTIGGAARRHAEDALRGDLEESLSRVERFRKWNEKASADIELWLDFKALRNAIEKLGEEMRMDGETREALAFMEWDKWDTLTGSANLPTKSGGGISATLDLTFSQPVETLTYLQRPAGAFRMLRSVPADTLGLVAAQLGGDVEATLTDIARALHETSQRGEPQRLRRNLDWARQRLANLERQLNDPEEPMPPEDDNDKDGKPRSQDRVATPRIAEPKAEPAPGGDSEDPEDPKEWIRREIAQTKAEIAELEQRLRDFKARRFSPDPEGRTSEPSEGERFYDEINARLRELGIERAALAQVIGSEIVAGFVALPDPTGDALDDMFSHNWFVNLELREGHAEMKKKLVDWMTGKALPKDADDWQKEEAKRRAEKTLFKKVDGGEILRERGLEGLTLFFGDNLVGMAGSEEIALRVLKANAGGGGLSPSVIPGGAVASKLLFIDLAELLARTQQQSARWETRERRFITPLIDVRKLLKGGLRLGVFSSETPTRLTFSASTSGENSLRPLLETLCGELEIERAWRHDEDMLQDLSNGLNSWLSQNEQSLKALPADKLKEALAAITPAKLMDAGFFSPQDGMRSAFDPALARRFAAMLESGGDELGGEGGPGDMKESGYDWFGLPATWPFGDDLDRGWGELRDIWMVCASKGNWMRNGRAAIVFSASALRVVWLEEADFKRIRQANAAGRRVAELPEAEPAELPRWKVKARLARQRWDTYAAQDYVRRAVEAAKAEGREFELRFDGSKEEDPLAKLRQLLGIGPDEWFHLENPRRLEIEAKGDKFRVRIKQGDLWIEMDQDGNITTSWDNE